ncbi:MAG: VOC family protein [Candidatus Competibacteraceae bacterium]|jgi:PhnB protein|nr:VOC family protein [Candidatus Competibacteraceae bacterium]
MQIQAYLFFSGSCEEAIEFYRGALGAEVEMLMRFKESPDPTPPDMIPPDWDNKIMHASLRIGDSTVMVSDGCPAERQGFNGFSLSISVTDSEQADRFFAALAEGGQVQMPLAETFWSPRFGMVTDRFGVSWMINLES